MDKCFSCGRALGSKLILVDFFGSWQHALCSSRCLLGFAFSEFQRHTDEQLKKAREAIGSAKVAAKTALHGEATAEAVTARMDDIGKALYLIDHVNGPR